QGPEDYPMPCQLPLCIGKLYVLKSFMYEKALAGYPQSTSVNFKKPTVSILSITRHKTAAEG
ncbi:MAG: hypothetical protein NC412_11220, partial [Roseburia sp.]|nr:hypothetical protein [Roseburia sp.]MCM1278890.1 hypothetical protein [Robinsoniella sp.]